MWNLTAALAREAAALYLRGRAQLRPASRELRLSRPPSFIRCFLEDQRDAFSLLGFVVFFAVMAIGASAGGDLSTLGSERGASRRFWEFFISSLAFGVCILVPIWYPLHLSRAWQFGALGLLGLTHALAAVFTIRRWR